MPVVWQWIIELSTSNSSIHIILNLLLVCHHPIQKTSQTMMNVPEICQVQFFIYFSKYLYMLWLKHFHILTILDPHQWQIMLDELQTPVFYHLITTTRNKTLWRNPTIVKPPDSDKELVHHLLWFDNITIKQNYHC